MTSDLSESFGLRHGSGLSMRRGGLVPTRSGRCLSTVLLRTRGWGALIVTDFSYRRHARAGRKIGVAPRRGTWSAGAGREALAGREPAGWWRIGHVSERRRHRAWAASTP